VLCIVWGDDPTPDSNRDFDDMLSGMSVRDGRDPEERFH